MAFGRGPRVILADCHAMVAEGVRLLLQPYCEVLAVVTDGQALIDQARELRPDVVIAEISMPVCSGIDAIRAIRKGLPEIRAVCLTAQADRRHLTEAIEAGALGYVLKHAPVEDLRLAIVMAMQGESFISPLPGDARLPRIGRPRLHPVKQLASW
ncbi:MAG TPA: response regulator transcription factor [Nevskia sp.]|nr:response regulator transcription factor [Nevskia sp.]